MDLLPTWHAVFVTHQHERRVVLRLQAKGFEAFTPLQHVPRDRGPKNVPMFSHYVFCRFRRPDRTSILRTASVIELATVNGTPIEVSDVDIQALVALSSFEVPIEVCAAGSYSGSGEPTQFSAGPLAGIDGHIAKSSDGSLRWFRTFHDLQRSIAISIDSFVEEWGPVTSAKAFVNAVAVESDSDV